MQQPLRWFTVDLQYACITPRQLLVTSLLAGLFSLGGCQSLGKVEPGGPGASEPEPVVSQPQETVIDEPLACDCPPPSEPQQCEQPAEPPPVKPAPAVTFNCPPPRISAAQARRIDDLLIIGRVENVYLPDNLKFKARIDTGAELSSLHARDVVEFERDGKPWVRFALENDNKEMVAFERRVKRYITTKPLVGEPQRRPIIAISIALGPLSEQVELTLADRADNNYDLLIGRNFLRDRALVDVSKKFTATPPKK